MLSLNEPRVYTDRKPVQHITRKYQHVFTVHEEVSYKVKHLEVPDELSLLRLLAVHQLTNLEVVVFDKAV
jgi:hypothetical protein